MLDYKTWNGTDIYEGDILEHIFRNILGEEIGREYYVVNQTINGWELRDIKSPRHHRSLKFCHAFKVIGNIYEHAELLGGK